MSARMENEKGRAGVDDLFFTRAGSRFGSSRHRGFLTIIMASCQSNSITLTRCQHFKTVCRRWQSVIGSGVDLFGDLLQGLRRFGNLRSKLQRQVTTSPHVSEREAVRILKQTDKMRKAYHKNYTGMEWNDPNQYHRILNSDRISANTCVEMICALYNSP